MLYVVSKFVGFVVTPYGVAVLGLLFSLFLKGKWCRVMIGAIVLWMLVTGCPWVVQKFALSLEKEYPRVELTALPSADAILVLGGGSGMANPTNGNNRISSDLYNLGPAADRITMGARLWRAGKAKEIIITGPVCGSSTVPFLVELGVPTNVIRVCESPRTTEEEARLIGELYKGKKLFVVTTAIHMRRATMLLKKFAPSVEFIPVATDYVALPWLGEPFEWPCFIPKGDAMNAFNYVLHEYIGYWARE